MKHWPIILYLIAYSIVMPVVCAILVEEFTCYEDVTVRQGQYVSLVVLPLWYLVIKGARKVYDDYHKPRYTPPNQ